jgi:hypothetical protein
MKHNVIPGIFFILFPGGLTPQPRDTSLAGTSSHVTLNLHGNDASIVTGNASRHLHLIYIHIN